MTSYAVARLDEIEELTDGREPFRPVRHHFGISSFGVNAWTARGVGDRIINEHDESEPDSDEELYIVVSGRAVFELDGDRVAAPTGTLIFAPPGVKRTAFARASRAGRLTRWITSRTRSTARSGLARTRKMIRTSTRSAMNPRSRS